MINIWTIVSTIALASALVSCTTVREGGGANAGQVRLFLPPFSNATEDEHAGQALTELMTTALMERGYPVTLTESTTLPARAETASGSEEYWLAAARSSGATHLILGTVLEYRYKTDLDGDPTVGISVRVVDARDGRTVWQGSSAKVCVWFASLTRAGQSAAHHLAARMPLEPENKTTATAASSSWVGHP
jgi:polysaccharide biosynthesis protein PelC